jgi:hypothetical protein
MTGQCSADLRKFVLFFYFPPNKRNCVNDQAKTNFIVLTFEHKLRTNKAVIKAIESLYKHK